MPQVKVASLTLKTIDHQGQITAEVSLIIEVPIAYAAMTNPALAVQEYIRALGPQFSSVDVEDPNNLIVRS